jgi:membrane associated rhomboid family serine protease
VSVAIRAPASNSLTPGLIKSAPLVYRPYLRHLGIVKTLYLHHVHPQWWQWVTSIFCHASWAHLSGNIFFLYVFGTAATFICTHYFHKPNAYIVCIITT